MAMEAMVDFLCGYIPWTSFLGCLQEEQQNDPHATIPPNADADADAAEGGVDPSLDRDSAWLPAASAAAADGAAADGAAAAASTVDTADTDADGTMPLQNLTDATTTFLSTLSSLVTTLSGNRSDGWTWTDLGRSVAGAARTYAGVVGTFVLKADIWHAALVVGLLLLITAKLWTKFVSELLGNLFRKPLKKYLGIEYDSIHISTFRLTLSVRELELRPSESDLARDIVVAIIPSADVTSPALRDDDSSLRQKHSNEDWGDRVVDELQTRLKHKGGAGPRKMETEPEIDPFRGSTIRISKAGLGCSFHLSRVTPLVSLLTKWRRYRAVRNSSKASAAMRKDEGRRNDKGDMRVQFEDIDIESDGSGAKIDLEDGKTDARPEKSWLRFITFYVPAPRIRVRVEGVHVQVDKAYLAPEPPEGYLPSHKQSRSISFFRDDSLEAIVDDDAAAENAQLEPIPAAIVPSNSEAASEALPTFAGQDTLLQGLGQVAPSQAKSIIFHAERWVEHTKKNQGTAAKHSKKGNPKNRKEQSHSGGEILVDPDRVESKDDDMMNLLLQLVLRPVLGSVEVECTNISLTIAGADASMVQTIRKDNAIEPYRGNIALSEIKWWQRSLTHLSIQRVFASFEGPECSLNANVKGISMQVASPPTDKSLPSDRKYFQEPVHSKIGRRRTWHTIVPANNSGDIDVSGVLHVLVWALNYDHHWDSRELAVNVAFSNFSLHMKASPLFTALVHLDDFSDPNSSFGEWSAWLRKNHQLFVKPLSSEERSAYRRCYQNIQGIKESEPSSPKRQPSAVEPTDGSPSRENAKRTKKDKLIDQEKLDDFETRMTCDEILKERCVVLSKKWQLDASNTELSEFLRLTNSHIIKRKRPPQSKAVSGNTKSSETNAKITDADGAALQSPFERTFQSPVDALLSLVREKFHLLAPSIAVSASIDSIHLHFADQSFAERIASVSNCSGLDTILVQSKSGKRREKMASTLVIRKTALEIHQQSVIFSCTQHSYKTDSLRPFQNIKMTVDSTVWASDVSAVEYDLPTFVDFTPCGLFAMKPCDEKCPMLSFALDHSKSSNEGADSHLDIKLSVGHFNFIVNPLPLASTLAVLMAFSDLPFRDIESELKAQEEAERSEEADDLASKQLTQYTASSAEASDNDNDLVPNGIVLGGANLTLEANVSSISVVLLSNPAGMTREVLETTVQNISLHAKSSQSGSEDIKFVMSPFKTQQCRLMNAHSEQGRYMKFFQMPFKPAFEFGGASLNYSASLGEIEDGIITTANTPSAKGARGAQLFDVQLMAYVRSVHINISATTNASLLGTLNCGNIIAASLPVTEEATPDRSLNPGEKEKRGRREALKELWRIADTDGSGTLDVEEVTFIVSRLFSASSLNNFDELPKSQQLTEEELKREVRHFLSLVGGSSTMTRDITFTEVDALFQREDMRDLETSGVEQDGLPRDFSACDNLRGLIYYDDLMEYSSPAKVYELTGTHLTDTKSFLPPSSWKSGDGIASFWAMFETETGCTRTSLNGQKPANVQRKMVRFLGNYQFAKFCWKTLVKPGLLESQQDDEIVPATPRRAARIVTDWVLDKDTRCRFQGGTLDLFTSQVKQLSAYTESATESDNKSKFKTLYDVSLIIEMDEASVNIGNGLIFATPLLRASLARVNITASARFDSSSQDGIFAPSALHSQDEKDDGLGHDSDPPGRKPAGRSNTAHFEAVISVQTLNNKHARMEELVEAFPIFGNVSYALKESFCGVQENNVADHEVSCKVMFPKFIDLNVSPSAIDTAAKLNDMVAQASLEHYEELELDLRVEGIRDLWSVLNKPTNEDLDAEDLSLVVKYFLADDTARTNKQMTLMADSVLKALDADGSGYVSFTEVEQQIRSGRVAFKPSHLRLQNHTGVTIKFHSRSAMEKQLAQNPSITQAALVSSFAPLRQNGICPFAPDATSIEAYKSDGIILYVPGCKIIDVPLLVYQSLMVHLKSEKASRRSRRRSQNDNDDQSVSGFDPYLTLVPVSSTIDAITIKARSPLIVKVETPIHLRVCKVADLGDLHSQPNKKGSRRKARTVNLARKNVDLSRSFHKAVNGAPIVFERSDLAPGAKVGLPINIMLSSSYHFLVIGDVAKDGQVFWRNPVLLTKDFLFNPRQISEVVRCHASSGIAIQRNRLNVHRSSRSRRAKKASRRTAWDVSISVLPSFVFTNSLPFNIQFRCWQSGTSAKESQEEALTSANVLSIEEKASAQSESGREDESIYRHRKVHYQDLEGAHRNFATSEHASTGTNVLLNGINTKEKLFIQVAQDCSSERIDINELIWAAPLSVDLKKLKAAGNRSGVMALPNIKGTLGDDADFLINVSVERNGVPTLSIFAPYWLTNKTGMKIMLRFSGRDDSMYDCGEGGLPVMAITHVAEKKDSGDRREVAVMPIEGATLESSSVWWDQSTNGQLVCNSPPLIAKGKSLARWSDNIGLDAVGSLGECNAGGIIFGVSIETQTGKFYRSNCITFGPRYVFKNNMHIPITILPVSGHLSDVARISKRLEQNGLPETLKKYKVRPDAFTTLKLGESTVVYKFEDLTGLGKEKDKPRFYLMRVDAESWNYVEQWHIIRANTVGTSYFVERDGINDSAAGIVKVDVQQSGPTKTTSVLISPRSPFRIENRSVSQYIQFVQDDANATVVELPPMSQCSYSWDNPYGKKRIRVVSINKKISREYLSEKMADATSPTSRDVNASFASLTSHYEDDISTPLSIDSSEKGRLEEYSRLRSSEKSESHFIKRKRLYSRKSRSYDPMIVGAHKSLPYDISEETSSLLEGSSNTESLHAETRIVAGSRVLSFNDSQWRLHQGEVGMQNSGGYWKGVDFDFFALGLSMSLMDDFPHEIMCCTLRHFSLYKHQGKIETTLRLRHIQVDSMFSSARYPVVLEPLPLGVDRRVEDQGELSLMVSDLDMNEDSYWLSSAEWPVPFFEASISYLPQEAMTWIPSLIIYLSPLRCTVELAYLLRIADLLINSLPEADERSVARDTINTLESVNAQLEYRSRGRNDATTLTYIENFQILPTLIDFQLSIKPDEEDTGVPGEDDEADESMVALSSLGNATSSNLTAGLLTWVNNVAAKFAHVSPRFSYDGMNRVDTYANAEDLIYEVVQFYVIKTIVQSYKVLFSMELLGDPQELLDHYRSGISDIGRIATGDQEVGKGLTSLTKNVFGGTLDWAGKVTGEVSDLLSDIASNEFTSKDLKPKKSSTREDAPGNIGEGVIDGTTFLAGTLAHGVLGLVGNPYRGLKKGSAKAVAKGTASGVLGLAVAPFVGALGFTARVMEGTANTTSLLEVGYIEARCRPSRVVTWGSSIGQVVLPYIKGIGIRIHSVRYQKRYKVPGPAQAAFEADGSFRRELTAKEARERYAAEDKRKYPARKVISIMRSRDKEHILTSARRPKLIEDGSSQVPQASKYAIVYEETLTLRPRDMELSDVIAVYLWHHTSVMTGMRKAPLGICRFTVGDALSSIRQYYSSQLEKKEVQLSKHSAANAGGAGAVPSSPLGGHVAQKVDRRNSPNRSSHEEDKTFLSSNDMFQCIKEARDKMVTQQHSSVSLDETDHIRDSFLSLPNDSVKVMPPIQEFSLMKPVPKRSRTMHRKLASAITEEMESIKRAEERALAFFESDSDFSDSDSDFDNYAKIVDEDEEDPEKSLEHLHGHVSLSFFPILW